MEIRAVEVYEMIDLSDLTKGNFVSMAALDVQKAFDCINHDILCSKLELMGIQSSWFRPHLSNRKQIVNIGDVISKSGINSSGVPRSILGPLLYLCYSNDIELATYHELIFYTVDTTVLVPKKNQTDMETKLSEDPNSCNKWFTDNKLSLHPAICECILFVSKRKNKHVTRMKVKYIDQDIHHQD